MNDDKLYLETDKCFFYSNSWTQGINKWAKEWGFKRMICLLAVQKSNPKDKDYVLIRDNEIIYEDKNYESLATHIDMIATSEGKKRD